MSAATVTNQAGAQNVRARPQEKAGMPLDEASPYAMAMGYKANASMADKTNYRHRADDQRCGTCQFYRGKPGEAGGNCNLAQGQRVSSSGWCGGWRKIESVR